MNNRDYDILEHIIRFCDEIDEAINHFGNTYDELESSSVYKNAVSMCILQIGELTVHLSDEFRAKYNEMPWQDIKAMRNIAAHHYASFDTAKLWETITDDLPELREYCNKVMDMERKNNSEQYAKDK